MYMSGNSLQIFSIMMVFMLFKTPLTAVLNIQPTFARLESPGTKDKMILVKITFVLMNLLAVALGTWKINQMGLLPYVFLDKFIIRRDELTYVQDNKIGLVGMGDGEGAVGEGVS
jgi:hypothetical protein